MTTGYEWLVDKMYYGCNPFPQHNIQDGRRIKVLRIETAVPTGDVSYTSGDKPQSDTARRIANTAGLDNTRVVVETQATERKDRRTWTTYAKWVAKELRRQSGLGWITICPDCGSTDTKYVTEGEITMGECNTCGIWWEPDDSRVQSDQARQLQGLSPQYGIAGQLEHGPLDYVD